MVHVGERVRQVLGIDAAYLSDEEVLLPDFFPLAEILVKRRVPKAFSGDPEASVVALRDTAVILQTGILLAPSLPRRFPKRQEGEHAKFEIEIRDLKKDLEAQLADVLDAMEEALEKPEGFLLPSAFTVTRKGCRRCC